MQKVVRVSLVLSTLFCAAQLCAQSERYLAFLYMDANIGGSSGGHLALLLDETVYHFQYTKDQIFTLNREKPDQFYAVYNQNENRSVEATPLRLNAGAVEAIKTRLDSYFLVQQKYLRLLALMKQDAESLDGLSRGKPVSVDHSAYFFPAAQCTGARSGSAGVSAPEMIGPDYWAGIIGWDPNSRAQEAAEVPFPAPFVLKPAAVKPDVFPQTPASYSELLSEKIQADLAYSVLTTPHCTGAQISTDIEIGAEARIALQAILADLHRSARALLLSNRPDRGGALLLTMARIVAVQTSLNTNRLTLLDATPPDHMTGPRDALVRMPQYAELPDRARNICSAILREKVGSEDSSRQLNLAENCVTRYFELTRTDSALVRFYSGNQSPRGTGPVDLTEALPADAPALASQLSRQASEAHLQFEAQTRRVYSFNLITKNCATELLREIVQAFPSEETANAELGGNLYPSANFIPALASRQAGQLDTSEEPELRLSKRLTMLGKVYQSAHPLLKPLVYLRESNVAFSTLYSANEEDSMFLFFTDDALFLRPVFGVLNVSYAIVHAGLGCAQVPWDGGKRLRSGVRGVLFSLPELVFFNIRKGSYPLP